MVLERVHRSGVRRHLHLEAEPEDPALRDRVQKICNAVPSGTVCPRSSAVRDRDNKIAERFVRIDAWS
jgi:hypothetical protein